MVDPKPIGGGMPRVQDSTLQQGQAGVSESSRRQGAAFEALLEKLDGQAREIQRTSEHVERPDQLAGAVDQARTSLGEALSLGNQLLEAFRANQMLQPPADAKPDGKQS